MSTAAANADEFCRLPAANRPVLRRRASVPMRRLARRRHEGAPPASASAPLQAAASRA